MGLYFQQKLVKKLQEEILLLNFRERVQREFRILRILKRLSSFQLPLQSSSYIFNFKTVENPRCSEIGSHLPTYTCYIVIQHRPLERLFSDGPWLRTVTYLDILSTFDKHLSGYNVFYTRKQGNWQSRNIVRSSLSAWQFVAAGNFFNLKCIFLDYAWFSIVDVNIIFWILNEQKESILISFFFRCYS